MTEQMTTKALKIPHEPGKRYHKILNVLSSIMKVGLTEKEMDIIDKLNSKGGILTTDVRREIYEELGISSDYLNNYIKKLREKKTIIGDELNPRLKIKPAPDDQPHIMVLSFETKS